MSGFAPGWLLVMAGLGLAAGPRLPAAPTVLKLPPETAKLQQSSLPGYAIAAQKCGICHSADYVSLQPPGMNQAQWTAEMQKMQHVYGAPIDADEIKLLGIYLAVTYGDASSVSSSDRALKVASVSPTGAPTDDAQALLARNGCLGCHALNEKLVGPAYHDVAVRYKTNADAVATLEASIRTGGAGKWGQVPMPPFASMSDSELQTLAHFVLAQ